MLRNGCAKGFVNAEKKRKEIFDRYTLQLISKAFLVCAAFKHSNKKVAPMKAKWIVILIAVAVLFGLGLPISNLIIGPPVGTSITSQQTENPLFAKIAPALEKKCVNCHTKEYKLPFYARFPIAKSLIEQDIKMGTTYLNMAEALFPPDNKPVSEVVLAKIEQTTLQKAMPPFRYLALHWDGGLSASEQADLLAWIRDVRVKHYATEGIPAAAQQDVLQPLPQKVEADPAKVALGNKLFHDKRLSKDNSLACAGCHDLAKGGTDREPFSKGVGGAVGGINAPTVYNALFQFLQFWDGRAANLQEQADGPVNNPIEMASNWPEAIPKLQQDAELTQAFLAAYPSGYSKETITDAIATFERTLITPNSKFDKFLLGDASAMNEEEKQGHALFKKYNCATCHVGKLLGGQSFEKMGLKADYFADRGNIKDADYGRFSVTKKEEDRFKLKVPTLRNIALTAPYLHDSTTDKLDKVVQTMAKYQVGKAISAADTDKIVKFLNALTGEYEGKLLQ